jgi:hypothetical protein
VRLSTPAAFAAALSAATVLAAGVGFLLIGSPPHIRELRLDEQRVGDLQSLESAIAGYNKMHHRLPQSLDELHKSGVWPAWRSFGAGPYEYRPIDPSKYELCASFQTDSANETAPVWQRKKWSHNAGRVCFRRDAGQQ